MLSLQSDAQAVRRHLERILESPGFSRNERLSRFLRFVVERHLEGRDQELKESLIAIEVFGRSPGYDSKQDPIVRTEASRLRARLSEYYLGEGKSDSQTALGKTPLIVARRAAARQIPATLISGSIDRSALPELGRHFAGCFPLPSGPASLEQCLDDAAALLADRAKPRNISSPTSALGACTRNPSSR